MDWKGLEEVEAGRLAGELWLAEWAAELRLDVDVGRLEVLGARTHVPPVEAGRQDTTGLVGGALGTEALRLENCAFCRP